MVKTVTGRKVLSKEELIKISHKVAAKSGEDWKEIYRDLCYWLGADYWSYDYVLN